MSSVQTEQAGANRTIRSGFVALLITAAVLLCTRLLTDLLPQTVLPWQMRDAGTLAVSVFIESFPFVVLGTAISTAVSLWVPQRWFLKLLPQNGFLRRAVLSLLGILLPVCECGNVPLARGLLRRGLSPAEAITFVLAAPLLNPVTIITTYQAFGFENGILLWRIIGGFVIANLIGWVFSTEESQERLLSTGFAASAPGVAANIPGTATASADPATDPGSQPGKHTQLQQAAGIFTAELVLLMPALALGSVLAGGIQAFTPTTLLQQLGAHPVLSVAALVLLAAIVSICSTVDAFFMLGFAGTFMPGAIVGFLVFGAMIDIKMLLLLRTTFSTHALFTITVIALLATLALGFGVNLIV